MCHEDERTKINLALIGSIKQEILPIDLLANELIELIKEKYMEEFNNKYSTDFKKECSSAEIFEKIAIKRGFLLKAGVPDIEKAQTLLLNDFKNGKIQITFVGSFGVPDDLDSLKLAIGEVKPAHIGFEIIYKYLLIENIHEVMTIEDLEKITLEQFAFGAE